MTQWIGRTLSKVEIRQLLGRGGMAEVYLGEHTTLRRQVAVKVLHAHLVEDEKQKTRFLGEAQAIAALRHPNIVQVYDFDMADGSPYIVMELLEGVSLKDYLESAREMGHRLSPDECIRLIKPLASALDYAHRRGIVHRDVKPANVMLRSESGSLNPAAALPAGVQMILTDFGIARIADAARNTASGVVIGTPAYMSPEQVQGQPVDPRSDQYSFGIMVYEMLSGRLPFEGDTQASIMVKHLTETPRPLPDVNTDVQRVVDRALAKEPSRRFASIEEFAASLDAGFKGLPMPDSGTMSSATFELSPRPYTQTLEVAIPAGTGPAEPTLTTQQPSASGINLALLGGIGGALAVLLIVGVIAAVLITGLLRNEQPTGVDIGEIATSPAAAAPAAEAPAENAADTTAPAVEPAVPAAAPLTVLITEASLSAVLDALPPAPDGSVYEAWLLPSNPDESAVSMGQVSPGDTISFLDPGGVSLLATYQGFALSLEPASDNNAAPSPFVYQGTLSEEQAAHVRSLYAYTRLRNASYSEALIQGMLFQVEQHDSHLGFALDALDSGSLTGAKTHAEHVINIASGADGPDYGDWTGDGRPDNPGDDVGLMTYLSLAEDAARSAQLSPASSVETRALAGQVADEAAALRQTLQEAVDLSRSLSSQDTIEGGRDLIDFLRPLTLGSQVSALASLLEELGVVTVITVDPLP